MTFAGRVARLARCAPSRHLPNPFTSLFLRPPANARGRSLSHRAPSPCPAPPPGLYLVATPIGNLGDITLRALETLAGCDLIACEDSRVTRKLLDRFLISTPLTPYHEHNAQAARPKLMERLGARRRDRAGVRRRNAADLRSRLQAGARRRRRGPCDHPDTGRLGRAGRADRRRACRPTASISRDSCRRRRARGAAASPSSRASMRHWCCSKAARALPMRCAISADVMGEREAAVCRELTKLHEDIRRAPLASLAKDAGASGNARRVRDRHRPAARRCAPAERRATSTTC